MYVAIDVSPSNQGDEWVYKLGQYHQLVEGTIPLEEDVAFKLTAQSEEEFQTPSIRQHHAGKTVFSQNHILGLISLCSHMGSPPAYLLKSFETLSARQRNVSYPLFVL